MGIFNFVDFSGGYSNTVPSEMMQNNELLIGQNVWWRNGLIKRGGLSKYASFTASNLRGAVRVKIEGAWRTVVAVDTGTAVELRLGTTTAYTTMTYPGGTTHTLTTGYNCEFAVLADTVAVVNGADKPQIVYSSNSTVAFDTIERYDTRDIDDDYWYAGPYSSATSSGNYATNTSGAQSSASTSFQVSPASAGGGFWLANAQTFNKVLVKDSQAESSLTFEYQYFGRASAGAAATWVTATMVDTPTWAAVGNKAVEWDFPFDGTTGELLMDVGAGIGDPLDGRYLMRAHNTNTPATAPDAQGLSVHHTQYLGQLLLNDRPDTVAEHKSHIILGSGNWIRMSPRGSMKGWRFRDYQPFEEGGSVQVMVSHLDYLAIMMDRAIFGLLGNSFANWSVRQLSEAGTAGKRAAINFREVIYFVSENKNINQWDGREAKVLSKHIREDLQGLTSSDACVGTLNGEYVLVSFPSHSRVFVFDPDTLRQNIAGDYMVSIYKWTNYRIDQFMRNIGAGDNGLNLGIDNANVQLVRLNHQQWDEVTATATIDMQIQTRFLDFGQVGTNKITRRARFRFQDTSATSSYQVQFYRQDSFGDASSTAVTVTPSVASGVHTTYLTPPPGFSGENLGIFVRHQYQTSAKLLGVSIEAEERQY